ncbi:MAG: type IV pilin N-terminal domain-containing protein [Methanocorpusculum sp.]|nr:type IV pilin N-terminal domain-containing protein [Methanocorpusculum sp.]
MKDDAVSPVIGVMLMLSITIIIAAVLMAFAGGMADTKPATPSVDLSAEFVKNGSDIVLRLSHNGGDALNPKDIKVTAYVASASSSGEQLIIKDIIGDDNAWNAGESILLTADKTKSLLGIDDVSSAAEKSTPVEIGIYHTPSTNVIYHATILIE